MLPSRFSPTTTRRLALLAGLTTPWLVPGPTHAAQNATPATEITAEMLRDLERRRLQSLVDFDLGVAIALHAEDFQLINPAGLALSREDYLGSLESGFIDYQVFEPAGDIAVFLSPGSAILRYLSNLEIIVDGTLVPVRNYWHTDYYENRGGHWQAVLSHATEVLT